MRRLTRSSRWLVPALAVVVIAGCAHASAARSAPPRSSNEATGTTTSTTSTSTTTTIPAAVPVQVAVFPATGNAQLDALLPTLPPLLFEGAARVHYGYNPLDTCCHAGGYNPEPNDVWVGPSAFSSAARLTYVTVHELGHSLHIKTARAAALTAAGAGAPVVRAGSAWDDSEKVADCVAWVLYPAEAAASGITYWDCPDPWRSQVRAALQ
jgi:hypothetical protein